MRPVILATLSALLLLAGCAPPLVPDSPEACRVERITAVPMIPPDPPRTTRWAIEVALDGKPATMMLDSGANGMVIGSEAAHRLGLRRRPDMSASVSGFGGMVYRRVFEISRLGIGSQLDERNRFLVEMTEAQEAGRGFDGIIGMGPFDRNDVEIDFPGRTLTLYRARFCPSGAPPWRGEVHRFPRVESGAHSRGNLPTVTLALDGAPAHALLDTGATSTAVDQTFARRLGVPAEPPAGAVRSVAHTMSETTLTIWRHQFSSMDFAGVRVARPSAWIMDLGMASDMVVGLDVLARMRMWISGGSDVVYLAAPR